MAKEDSSLAMDAVLTSLGWRGRYQLCQLFLLLLCVFPLAFNILSIVFIGKANEYKCKETGNMTSHMIPDDAMNVTYGACSVTWRNVTGETMDIPCPDGFQFSDAPESSLMSEWTLVCDKEALTDVSQTLLLVGMMVGATVFTTLADKYGRKPFHIACSLGLLLTGVAQAFVPSFAAYLPLRFCLGAFQQGMGLTCGILCMELLPTRRRFTQAILGSTLWALGMVVLALLAFLMQHMAWRHLQLLIAAFSLYAFLLIWFLDESLRWLTANGKMEQAERILRKAATMNKIDPDIVINVFRTKALRQTANMTIIIGDKGFSNVDNLKNKDELSQNESIQHNEDNLPEEEQRTSPHDSEQNGVEITSTTEELLVSQNDSRTEEDKVTETNSILDFFQHKHVFWCTVVNGFVWCINAVTYYGLSMTSVTLSEDMYLGFFLSAVVELPTAIIFIISEKIGRKKSCDIFHIIAGLSLLASVTVSSLAGDKEWTPTLVIVLSLVGKFAISLTFALIFFYTPEQFPTNLRNASLGIASMTGRIGAMVAPFSRTLARHVPWAPGVLFGVLCLTLPVCMRILPETCGRELPQTIAQMKLYMATDYTVPGCRGKKKKPSQAI